MTAAGEANHKILRLTIIRIQATAGLRGKTIRVIHGEIQIPVDQAQEPMMGDGAAPEAHRVVAHPVAAVAAPVPAQDLRVAVTNYFNINRI